MPVKGLTQAEIDEATRAQVAAGGKSTDRANRLPGETASEANARITAAYKEMTAKPIITEAQKDAGVQVKFVRTEAGGVGEYQVIKPIGYTGPAIKVTEFTPGVIPANVKKTTGTSVGFNPDDYKTAEDMQRIAAKAASGKTLTPDEQVFMNKGVSTPATTPVVAPTATPTSAPDAAAAVRKLQSGQALTDAEKKLLGMSVTPSAPTGTPATPKKFTPAELQDIVRRLTSGQKLTPEEAAAVGVTEPNSINQPVTPTPVTPTSTKTVSKTVKNSDGSTTITYSDGTTETTLAPNTNGKKTVTSSTKNADGTTTVTYSDGTSEILAAGTPPPAPITVVPGPTGTSTTSSRMLASDTFANTFALAFGSKEASQPYVKILYDLVSGFYKSGSDIDEALNLAIRQAREEKKIPEFTKRFKGIFALEDRLRAGEAVTVPTIAEYIKSEAKVGELLEQAGMADLATQEFIGDAFSKGKSVAEITRILSGAFNTIDNAPAYLKNELSAKFPTVTRSGLAKALIAGDIGAQALEKEIKNISVMSAGKFQGVTPTAKTAENLANLGYDFASSLSGFGEVARGTPTMQKLQEISSRTAANALDIQEGLTSAIFEKNIKEQEKMRIEAEKEAARFGAKAGTIGSKSLASQSRANRLI
jgi:hypothetical protein